MDFVKTVMFLGIKRRVGANGVSYYVDAFCPGGESWNFYVKDIPENNETISFLMRCVPGMMYDFSFYLARSASNPKEMYLRITGVTDAA